MDITKEEFWKKLVEEDALFKSAQPSPRELMNLYTNLLNKGYKKVVVVNISSNMSGTFKTAKMVINNLNKEKDIVLYDTQLVSLPLGIMIKEAAKRSLNHESLEQILKWCDKFKAKNKTLIPVDSLKYLERGGRISKVAKSVGDFLNLKPIVTISQGSMAVEKKVFGDKSAVNFIINYVEKTAQKQSLYLYTAWGGTQKELDNINILLERFKNNPKITIVNKPYIIGPTVGTHAGPIYAVCIVPKLL